MAAEAAEIEHEGKAGSFEWVPDTKNMLLAGGGLDEACGRG